MSGMAAAAACGGTSPAAWAAAAARLAARRAPSAAATPNGTPSGGADLPAAPAKYHQPRPPAAAAGGSQDQIQLFGQTKIIPNESSSSLLIYATRQDMEVIKGIIAKLDVPLAQVLVEAVIIDVTLGNTFNFGVSAAQNPAVQQLRTSSAGAA